MGGGRYISHHVCASQLAWRRPPRPPRWKSTRVPRAPPPCPAPARPRPLPGLRPSPLPARRPPLPPVRGCLLRGASWGAGAPELREPRPHLWPPALTPGAPRRKAREAGRGFSPPPRARAPSSSPPKPLPARSLFPLPQPRESRTKESWRALGALPRCFPGATDAREPAPGERVGGQIREAAGWGR